MLGYHYYSRFAKILAIENRPHHTNDIVYPALGKEEKQGGNVSAQQKLDVTS